MTFDANAKQFSINSHWPGRPEEPESVANRLRCFLDSVATIDETLAPWSIGRRRRVRYQSVKDDLPELIRKDVVRSEVGDVEVISGYTVLGSTSDSRQRYMLSGSAGATYAPCNGLLFQTCSNRPVSPSIVTYAMMKAIMLATIACWAPAVCRAATTVKPDPDRMDIVLYAWMTYVTPANAAAVDLVGIPFSERTPDGGFLLSATNQIFDTSNSVHVEGARLISQATQNANAGRCGPAA